MGVGAGLYMYVVVVQKFTFAISSTDEFLFCSAAPCFRDDVAIQSITNHLSKSGSKAH